MTDSDYKAMLEKAKADLLQTQKELGEAFKHQEFLETRIAGLRGTIVALSRMLGEEFFEEDAMGLTDAIRQAFQSIGTGTLTPTEVRGRLELLGYDIKKYGNVMASVHTIINRLAEKGEIKQVGTRGDNKPAYAWVARENRALDALGTPVTRDKRE